MIYACLIYFYFFCSCTLNLLDYYINKDVLDIELKTLYREGAYYFFHKFKLQ